MAYLRAAILWPIARPEESMIVGECGADRLAG
ncbi:hypothetical protein F442_10600 [Phytophthora nicotianae P10297]|uniref:Uncharacterized protein n=2 Tax=Phytophthora nicotianae TaxID=4792 RepID=W2Z697_PHYNI|nr:hypothetical protein L917_10284 [Phytophthora nicotianae]ETP42491.1 hypothetical protein F442_10600 [Phytophthora nicotianae P10297]